MHRERDLQGFEQAHIVLVGFRCHTRYCALVGVEPVNVHLKRSRIELRHRVEMNDIGQHIGPWHTAHGACRIVDLRRHPFLEAVLMDILAALRSTERDVCDSRIEIFVADRTLPFDGFAACLESLLEVLGAGAE